MKKLFALVLWALFLPTTICYAQGPTQICFTSNGANCIPVSATNPFPVTAVISGGGTFGAAFPSTGIAVGFSDGTNLTAARVTSGAIADNTTPPTSGILLNQNFNMCWDSSGSNWDKCSQIGGTAALNVSGSTAPATALVIQCLTQTSYVLPANGNVGPLPCPGSGGVPPTQVINGGNGYETIAASQTGQILGASGAIGDYLSHCVVYPTTTSPGLVTVFDNTSTAVNNAIAFPGGASSISSLAPFTIPVGGLSINGAWKVTTGANLVVTCYGKFS